MDYFTCNGILIVNAHRGKSMQLLMLIIFDLPIVEIKLFVWLIHPFDLTALMAQYPIYTKGYPFEIEKVRYYI